jgi:hypothetical protein
VSKALPRGMAQWAGKQVKNEGVDYKCINQLREFYYFQKKLDKFIKDLPQETKDAYALCFATEMKWVRTKYNVKIEIAINTYADNYISLFRI